MASPVQIVLNPENYEEVRETGGGGGRKDFFAPGPAALGAHQRPDTAAARIGRGPRMGQGAPHVARPRARPPA